jgi:hypothetical protein
VEVGQEGADRLEREAGRDEEIGLVAFFRRAVEPGREPDRGLERARHRGPDRDDPASLAPHGGDRQSRLPRNQDFLRVERVISGVLGRHRLEGPGPDRQGQVGDGDCPLADPIEDLRREVESRRRRRHGQRSAREDRLVSLAVLWAVGRARGPADVGRKRDVSDPLEEDLVDRPVETDRASPRILHLFDHAHDPLREADGPAGLGPAARLGQSLPEGARPAARAEQKDLDHPVPLVAPVEPGVPDTDVVSDEQISRPQQLRQIGEEVVADLAGFAVEQEQAARAPGARLLGDPIAGKLVVEEIHAHVG